MKAKHEPLVDDILNSSEPEIRIKSLGVLSESPGIYISTKWITRVIRCDEHYEKVDGNTYKKYGRSLGYLEDLGLVKRNGSKVGKWKITPKGLEVYNLITDEMEVECIE